MPTIRRSVYIGLGGTGIKAIANAKKMYEDIFGEGNIPPQIAFVAIDFDKAIVNDQNLPTDIKDDFISLPQGVNPRQTYLNMSTRGMYKWLPPVNANYLPDSIEDGAAQVRTTGRLLTELITSHITPKIARAINSVKSLAASTDGYTVSKDNKIDVHVAMSLSGGTGCGSFINVAQIIRSLPDEVNLYGYGVLYGVFRAMDPAGLQTPRVRLNTYSALLDLDYFQAASITNPVVLNVGGQDKSITSSLYDNFYLIDNKNEEGEYVENVKVLCQALGTCMYLSGGELGDEVKTIACNVGWKLGNYNWENKLGWAQRIGVCQVVYKGEELAKLYTLKAKLELIRQFTNSGADVQQMATNWTEVAGVREDGDDYNMLIDSICSPETIGSLRDVALNIDETYETTSSDVKTYLSNYQSYPAKEALAPIRERIVANLKTKVAEILNGVGGVSDAQTFLTTLSRICAGYKGEMEDERKEFVSSIQGKEKAIDDACKEYQNYLAKVFKTKQGRQERIANIGRLAKNTLKDKLEARRREDAAEIFAVLLNEINGLVSVVKNVSATLDSLKDTYAEECAKAQNNNKASSLLFEYDLSTKERLNLTIGQNDVSLTAFTATLSKSLSEMTREEINAAFDVYAAALPRCEAYKTELIENVIQNLSDADYQKMKKEIARKCSPLLQLNDRGLFDPLTGKSPIGKMVRKYLVSIYKEDKEHKSRMETDSSFAMGNDEINFIPSDTKNMKQRVIFYRADSAIIPYCVEALDESVEYEYQTILSQVTAGNAMFHPHVDLQIYEEMKKKDFKFKPEMEDEGLFYWVCGHIFGWTEVVEKKRIMEKGPNGETIKEIAKEDISREKYIRYDKNKYWYWNQRGPSKGQNVKWNEINTTDRRRAYEYFKTEVLNQLRDDFKSLILSKIQEAGIAGYKLTINGIKEKGKQDYIDHWMCSNKSSVTYYGTNGNTMETEFVDEEWTYIEEKFIDALQLLK
jgi:hypothetical protein